MFRVGYNRHGEQPGYSRIATQLGGRLRIMRGPLRRETLSLQNIHLPSQTSRLAWLAEHVPDLPGTE